ncbi:hypothetical protein JCM5350_004864 [Sporobolomyces pararoseus]
MTTSWSYATKCSLINSDTPSLALDAHANSSRSLGNNTTFATSQLALDIVVQVDGAPIESIWLTESAVVRETVDWLTKDLVSILSPPSPSPTTEFDTYLVGDSPTIISPSEAIEKSLLLAANQPHLVDPVKLPDSYPCASTSNTRKGGGRGRGKAKERRGRQPSEVITGNLRRSTREKKVKHQEEDFSRMLEEDNRDDDLENYGYEEIVQEDDWTTGIERSSSQTEVHSQLLVDMENEVDMLDLDLEVSVERVDEEQEADEDEEMLLWEGDEFENAR